MSLAEHERKKKKKGRKLRRSQKVALASKKVVFFVCGNLLDHPLGSRRLAPMGQLVGKT